MKKTIHGLFRRHRVNRKLIAEVFQGELEPFSQAQGVFNRLRQITKQLAHLGGAVKKALAVLREQFASSIQMGVMANASEDIQDLPANRRRVKHATRGQQRKTVVLRHLPQDFQSGFLAPELM